MLWILTVLVRGFAADDRCKLIASPADLYYLEEDATSELDRMGKKSAQNALKAIEKSKQNDLSKLLYALGIRQVGAKAGKVLASHFKTFDAFANATLEELTAIQDIGPITAQFILDWLASPQSQHLIQRLKMLVSTWNRS